MKKITLRFWQSLPLACLLAAVAVWTLPVSGQDAPLRRADSYFGFHFDFHADTDCDRIGRNLTAGMIDTLLTLTRPDYIQVDCKGHRGYSSYPTQVGNPAPGFEQDILQLFREVTLKHNVALYVHYSGIWDTRAIQLRPEWAAIDANGNPDKDKVGYYSGYVEELLVPQIKEIASYGVDGIWVDGECWAAVPDYSADMAQRWQAATGRTSLPGPDDADYNEFLRFNRKAFQDYVARYTALVKEDYPDFQITSNWAYSSIMPEKVDIPLDYLSGDVAGQNGVYSAAWEARCMAPQGMPWDLMAWAFTYNFEHELPASKSTVMIRQEAAEVMAMGGGFQAYYQQNRDGSLKTRYFDQMTELAAWIRERQPYAQGGQPIPQIALWYSTESYQNELKGIYAGLGTDKMAAVLNLLLDGCQSVEVLMDHHLRERIHDYPLVILPEWESIGERMQILALEYVMGGGNLMLIGTAPVRTFAPELGIVISDPLTEQNAFLSDGTNYASLLATNWVKAQVPDGVQTFGVIRTGDDPRYYTDNWPMASIHPFGNGRVVALYADLNKPYREARSHGMVQIMNNLIGEVLPEPVVQVEGEGMVHVVPARLDDRWMIHLINAAGDHSNKNVYAYDQLQALPPLSVVLRTDKPIRKATLQPEGQPVVFQQIPDGYRLSVPSVELYSIVELEF